MCDRVLNLLLTAILCSRATSQTVCGSAVLRPTPAVEQESSRIPIEGVGNLLFRDVGDITTDVVDVDVDLFACPEQSFNRPDKGLVLFELPVAAGGRCYYASNDNYNADIALYLVDGDDCAQVSCQVRGPDETKSSFLVPNPSPNLSALLAVVPDRFGSSGQYQLNIFDAECPGPPNQSCGTATNIVTMPFTDDPYLFYVDQSLGDYSVADSCESSPPVANGGAWYSLAGDGKCYDIAAEVRAGVISVFEGNQCSSLSCTKVVTSNELLDVNPPDKRFQRRFLLETQDSATYTLLVTIADDSSQSRVKFSVKEIQCPSAQISFDQCSTASEIGTIPFDDKQIVLTSELAENPTVEACNIQSTDSRGLWYELEGDGRCYRATLNSDLEDPSYGRVDVYSGTNCDECTAQSGTSGSSDSVKLRNQAVSFATESGSSYYLYASHYRSRPFYIFHINVQEIPCEELLPSCEAPVLVTDLPLSRSFNLTWPNSAVARGIGSCSSVFDNDSGAVFFRMLGDGSDVIFSADGSDGSVLIAIYTGDCDGLICGFVSVGNARETSDGRDQDGATVNTILVKLEACVMYTVMMRNIRNIEDATMLVSLRGSVAGSNASGSCPEVDDETVDDEESDMPDPTTNSPPGGATVVRSMAKDTKCLAMMLFLGVTAIFSSLVD